MTQIMVDVRPETIQHIHALLDNEKNRGLTFGRLAGLFLDNHVAYQLEIDRMRPTDPYGMGEGFPRGGDA